MSIFAGEVNQRTIKIQTLKNTMSFLVDNTITVNDVKNHLDDYEGIPVDQQELLPLFTSWWNLKLFYKHGTPLEDEEELITDVMDRYNTTCFQLYLTLKKRRDHE